jgi:cytochrome bd-type quinol oxidase subunit 1
MPLTFLHFQELGPETVVVAIIFFATIFILLIAIGYALMKRVEDKWPELTGKRKKEPKNHV